MKRFLILLTALLLLVTAALAAQPGTVEITVPEGVSLRVYDAYDGGSAVKSTDKRAEDGNVIYTYALAGAGNYRFETSGNGFASIIKNFSVTSAQLAQGVTLNANVHKVLPGGYQSATVHRFSDGVHENLLPTASAAWANYEHIFDTPYFTAEHGALQQTTNETMMAFLQAMDDADDNLYLYTLGKSPIYGLDIPIVIFTKTDLSSAKTLEEAAKLVNANNKATIQYHSQIHGNEPASAEGCLAMIDSLDGDYGEKVLSAVNVLCIPRMNPDGARQNQRNNVADNMDMNRDHLYVQSAEVTMVHHAYNLFLPQVVMDGHEFNSTFTNTSATFDDVQMGAANSLNANAEVNAMSQELIGKMFDKMTSLELRPGHYSATAYNTVGRNYYNLYGSLSFLVETRGINVGLEYYPRRVLAHYATAETIIDYVVEHHDAVVAAVAKGRQKLTVEGATYEDTDLVVLEHAINKKTQAGHTFIRPRWDLTQGTTSDPTRTHTFYLYNEAVTTRVRPTAYVIPKGEAWAEKAVKILTTNGISHYELEPGSAVMLQQYEGSQTKTSLLPEALAEFPAGAYVFPMNQVGANVLALTMEPDIPDTLDRNGSLAQSGVITAKGGVFPLYCYIHNLNADGKVDTVALSPAPTGFTVTQPAAEAAPGAITGLDKSKTYELCREGEAFTAAPAGSDKIENLTMGIYYLRFAPKDGAPASAAAKIEVIDSHITEYRIYVGGNGASDKNHGRLESAPVETLVTAYKKLNELMKFAPQGTEGKIIFLTKVTISADTTLPAHDYPVVLTGKDGTCGIASGKNIHFSGETTLRNMTVSLTAKALRYICAAGHKMVIEETVSTTETDGYYYCISGGNQTASLKGGTDLTIRGGTWRNVYVTGYQASLAGPGRFTMTGGTVTNTVQPAYSGTVTGDITMDLSGATIGGNIYCGNTYSKDVTGNVTLILGEGTTAGTVYCGSREKGDLLGTVEVILAGGKVQEILPHALNKQNVVEAVYITIASDEIPPVTDAAEYGVDLSDGRTVALSDLPGTIALVRGGGTLQLAAGQTLNLKKAEGVTALTFETVPDDTAPVVTAPLNTENGAFTMDLKGKRLTVWEVDGRKAWYVSDAPSFWASNGATLVIAFLSTLAIGAVILLILRKKKAK